MAQEFTKTTVVETKVIALPCIKCNAEDLDFWQDRHYDSVTITCKGCKASYRGGLSWLNGEIAEAVEKVWNPPNRKPTKDELLTILKKQKEEIERRIKEALKMD